MDVVKGRPEGKVILRNVSWETYDRLVAEREERRAPRFFYDRGVLEILSPSAEHEEIADLIASLVRELAVLREIDMRAVGHTTFRREDLARGFEPDGSFYFGENAKRVRGKADLDLDVDPPPDLVVEVDRTSGSLNKLPIYARLGVPEVWRYVVGGRPEILGLRTADRGYERLTESSVLSPVSGDTLANLVESGQINEPSFWAREIRDWARDNPPGV